MIFGTFRDPRTLSSFTNDNNNNDNMVKECVVVVGGGFGGLYTALDLSKKLGDKVNIILIEPKVGAIVIIIVVIFTL